MTADANLITHLNRVLKAKLTGINQYFLHARMLKHRGHTLLADQEFKASLDAMKHSDMLVEHVLAIGGSPNLGELDALMIGETVEAMLLADLHHCEAVAMHIDAAIAFCENTTHTASAQLLKKIYESHQERADFIREQLTKTHAKECA